MVDESKQLCICLVASSGGHLSQLLKLAESWKGYKAFFITTTEVSREMLGAHGAVYIVGECNRKYPRRVIKVLIECTKAIFKEKPDVVISTGAAVGCMACFLAKLSGSKIVWIDSIANVDQISLSGRLVRHIADLFLVQWPELAQQYSHVEYVGSVI